MRLEDALESWNGFLGGCGPMQCTGPKNVLIEDQDGALFGVPTTVIPMNEDVGGALETCSP